MTAGALTDSSYVQAIVWQSCRPFDCIPCVMHVAHFHMQKCSWQSCLWACSEYIAWSERMVPKSCVFHQETHCCSCEILPLWSFLLPEQHQTKTTLPSKHANICLLRQATEGRGQRPFRRAGFSASMPQPAGPHAQLAALDGPLPYQATAHAHRTGRGGNPDAVSLPIVQQESPTGIPMTAAPLGFTSGTWAADDKKPHTTAMRKRQTGGGRITVGHNAILGQQPW